MPALFVFLLKVNIALIIFCLGYYLVLRKLTFYTLNRFYLCIAIISSSVYPVINVSDFVQRHQQLVIPVQRVVLNWKAPAEQFIQQPGYWYWATLIFWIGTIVFAARLLTQLFSLYKLYKKSKPGNIMGHNVRIIQAAVSPFSFWQSIYINPDNIEPNDVLNILQHEQVHVKEWHTLDILLAEISVIFYWFNPGVWLMKKAVRENIEFITDRKILQKGMDSKAYQYSLLNVSIAATASAGITNHFNFSTLKKRIKMMNAKRSSNVNLTRYALLTPVVIICLFAFSLSKAELVKNSTHAFKSFSAMVNVPVTAIKKTINSLPKLKTQSTKIALDTPVKTLNKNIAAPITFKESGTGKKFLIQFDRRDSLAYVVDGKRVSIDEFKNLEPSSKHDIVVLGFDDVPSRAFGFEKDVMYFKDRKDSSKFNEISTQNKDLKFIERGVQMKPEDLRNYQFMTKSGTEGQGKVSKVIINGQNTVIANGKVTDIMKKDPNTIYFTTTTAVHLKSAEDFEAMSKNARITFKDDGVDDFSNKLCIIDGKEATQKDMKKLTVAQMQSITVKNGKEMLDKYGDKAKNGVLFITTRKAN